MRLAAWPALAVAAVLASAPSADAAWSRQRIGPTAASTFAETALAGNEHGDAAIVFEEPRGLSVAVARAGSDFGRSRSIPGSAGERDPRVAVDERGDVLVAWTHNDHTKPARPNSRDDDCCERIRLALLQVGSTRFAGPKTVGAPGVDSSLQAFSFVNGRVGIGWTDRSNVVAARFSRRGLQLGRAVRVRGDGESVQLALAAVPLRTGPVLTFERYRYDSSLTLTWSLFELRPRSGAQPSMRKLLSAHAAADAARLAANARGDQALAWSAPTGPGSYDVFAAARPRTGAFHPRRVSRHGSFESPRVALASNGAAVAAWDDGQQIFTAGRQPGGAFGDAIGFGPRLPPFSVNSDDLAANPGGRAVLTWRQSTQKGDHEYVALRTRGGRRLSAHDLGHITNFGSLQSAALDAHGVARVGWANGPVYAARARFPGR